MRWRQGPLDFVRDAASGVSAAFVLLTQMLTLGLIAYGALGPVGVEAGVRAAFAAAIFGNLTAAVLGGALLPNEIPRASTVLVFAAFVARLAGDAGAARLPGGGVEEILFLAALCLALTGIIQVALRRAAPGQHRALRPVPGRRRADDRPRRSRSSSTSCRTSWACTATAGTAKRATAAAGTRRCRARRRRTAGWQPWTLLVALFTIATVFVVGRRWPKAPSKLIGVAAGTAVAAVASLLLRTRSISARACRN